MDNYQKENTNNLKGADKKNSEKNTHQQSIKNPAEDILAVLDLEVEIPENLIDKVLERKNSITIQYSGRFDFSKYLQIAAVFAAAVLVGILLGKNADSNTFNKKQDRENRALIELREKHHLSEDYTFGRL